MKLKVTISATGLSEPISLPGGDNKRYTLRLYDPLGGAFQADLQAGRGAQFDDMYWNSTEKVTISDTDTPKGLEVPGGLRIRANVASLTNPLTLIADPI